jgi:translation initiation factor IF-2
MSVATKTRVHDLAAEFGIEPDRLMTMLSELDISVRSHLSPLEAAQVAIVRARWERDKRKRAAAPEEPKRVRRRAKVEPAPEPEPSSRKKRRRTAAEMAEKQAVEEAEQRAREAALAAAAEVERQLEPEPKPSLEERAAALFRDLPATAEPADVPAEAPLEAELAEAVTEEAAPDTAAETAAEVPAADTSRPEAAKPMRIPRPVTGVPRIKPVASAAPRPIASAAPGEAVDERRRDKGKKRKKGRRSQVDQEAVQANISRTMASLKGAPAGKKAVRRRDDEPSFREREEQRKLEEREREKTLVRVNEFITVSELADILGVNRTDIVSFCFKELGMMVTVNQRLDFDQIELIAGAFGFQAVQEAEYAPAERVVEAPDEPEDLMPRPPVVTVMGHVDHGKTSLLDYVRKTNVIAGEAGGITQHIGAYYVDVAAGKGITFLDTPGHEAFTAMRARGAQVTDLVVLVVAADDQVMPQTVEAISHAKNAGVPLIVAINKIDLPTANVDKVKQDLLQHGVVLEEFGGDTMAQAISAKKGIGVDELLEKILLQADLLDKKANPDRPARGTVIESTLDPGKGPVATVLVQNGTLRVGEDFIAGNLAGRVRALLDARGNRVEAAGPSVPVQVLGFDRVPQAGDHFSAVADAAQARDIAQKRQRLDREAQLRRSSRGISLEDLSKQIEEGTVRSLKIVIKADQAGPAEALADAFAQLSTPEVKVEVIHRGVGAISESDVLLAKASDAIVVGFHVRPDANARTAAEREHVDLRTYRVIYDAVEEMKAALEGLLAPEEREVVLGEAEIRALFKISGVGTVAGCYVRHGVIRRSGRIRVVRNGVEVYDGQISSLKRFKDDVREVKEGLECGIGVENFNDVKVGDVLESYTVEQVARTLDQSARSPEQA